MRHSGIQTSNTYDFLTSSTVDDRGGQKIYVQDMRKKYRLCWTETIYFYYSQRIKESGKKYTFAPQGHTR